MENITISAVAIIVVTACIYTTSLIRLFSLSSKIKKAKELGAMFRKNALWDTIINRYINSRTITYEGYKRTTHHAEEFFNAGEFARVAKLNLKHISSAPGLLSGLGVLGTFVGLALSVSTFDSSDSTAIMTSIKTLLNGMSTAFLTSLVGMFLSSIYIIIQKWAFNNYDNAIASFTNRLDSEYYISPDEIVIAENEKTNEEVLRRLAEIQSSMTIVDEEENSISVGNMMMNLYEESEKQSQALESFTTDLSNELNASLGKTMDVSIVPLIQNLERSHEAMNERISELSNNITSPATDVVTTAVSELQTNMQKMASEFRDTISGQTIGQMEALAANLSKAGEMLNTLPQSMQMMSDKVASSFGEVKSIISGLQTTIAQQQTEMIEKSRSTNDQLMTGFLQKFSDMSSFQNEIMNNTKNMVSDLQSSVSQQQKEMEVRARTANEQQMADFMQKFSELTAFQQTALEKMSERLNATISSLTEQVEKAMAGVFEQQNGIADVHTRSSREIERLLQSFGQSIANMHSANNESADMLATMNKASENLNTSTDNLRSLATSLSTASDAVIEQQKESVAKFEEMQQQSQAIINQLSSALSDAQKMIDGYTNDFETIKTGLKDVFKGINEGLKDYSATLRESTGGALSEYSEAMTKSTAGLKNIAEALAESAEELSDDIDKLKRMR